MMCVRVCVCVRVCSVRVCAYLLACMNVGMSECMGSVLVVRLAQSAVVKQLEH